jgi:hypothetical protein
MYINLTRNDPEPENNRRNGHLVQASEQPEQRTELGATPQAERDTDESDSTPAGKGDAWEGDDPVAPPQAGTDSDANSPARAVPRSPAKNAGGESGEGRRRDRWTFPFAKPISQLQVSSEEIDWIWKGFLGIDAITMLSAQPKGGKTTFLSHLLKNRATPGLFCGRELNPGRTLVVTEKSERIWATRRDKLGLDDSVFILSQPFSTKPTMAQWIAFLDHLKELADGIGADLIILDTIANLSPVRNENDAAEVQEALMPLRKLAKGRAVFMIHHTRKSGGDEGTGARGSGAFTAFVDMILELKRPDGGKNITDRRRLLTSFGRLEDTPNECVIELATDGSGYTICGSPQEVAQADVSDVIESLLPDKQPGLCYDELLARWPPGPKPGKKKLTDALRKGFETDRWDRDGDGKKGKPYRYWVELDE